MPPKARASTTNSSGAPSKKRRLGGSCDNCKQRKIKCDSAMMPNNICSNCATYGEECTHRAIDARKRPNNLDKKIKSILTSGTNTPTDPSDPAVRQLLIDLATEVRKLEGQLSDLESQSPEPYLDEDDGDSDLANVIRDKTDVRNLSAQVQDLILHDERSTYFGKSSMPMLIHEALAVKKAFGGLSPFDVSNPLPYIFPEPQLMDDLITLYFAEQDPISPLLYRPKFEQSVRNGRHFRDREFGGVVLAVCAVGARYCLDGRALLPWQDEETMGWQWYQQIRPLPSSMARTPTLCSLQMYFLCCTYVNGSNNPEAAWCLPGFGLRMAQGRGAHRQRLSEQWTVDDEDYDVELPLDCDYEYWEGPQPFQQPEGKPSSMSYWIKFLELLKIMTLIHRNLYPVKRSEMNKLTFPEVYRKNILNLVPFLKVWHDTMPEHLRWNPNSLIPNPVFLKQAVILYSNYYWAQIQLHRPFICFCDTMSLSSSLTISIAAARECCHMTIAYQMTGNARVGSTPIYYSAIILVINIWRARIAGEPREETEGDVQLLKQAYAALRYHEDRWPIAGRFGDAFLALIADLDIVVPPPNKPRAGASEQLKVLSAWFNQHYPEDRFFTLPRKMLARH
ncbi:hypothetical protein BDZ89DRAFT_1078168, partial [Hymenopellis radicata]